MTEAMSALVAADGQRFELLCYSLDDAGQAHIARRPVMAWALFAGGGFEGMQAQALGALDDRTPAYVGEGILLPDGQVVGPYALYPSEDDWRAAMAGFAAERAERDAAGWRLQ
jgi:hypothetical protein